MYLHQELREVSEARKTEALKRIHWLHSLMSIQPGFIRSLACRYLGSTHRYLWLRFWTSPEGNTDFRKTDEAKQFANSRPEGFLYEPLPGGIADAGHWHSIVEPQGAELGNFLVRYAFEVEAARVDDFMINRREHANVVLETPGIMSSMTLASNDSGSTHYLTYMRALDREAVDNLLESSRFARLREQTPADLFKPLTTECYAIVDEIAPLPSRPTE